MWWAVALSWAAEVPAARMDATAPWSVSEIEARDRDAARRCSWVWGVVVPGAGRFCVGRPVEGGVLAGLAAGELAAGLALAGPTTLDPLAGGGRLLPFRALADVYATSIGLEVLDRQRAQAKRFVPEARLGSLVAAPFSPSVLRRPGVWAGGAVLTAGAVALTVLTAPRVTVRGDPNVLGATLRPEVGYPVLGAINALTFLHVAVSEEVVFRGLVQSGLARRWGPTAGWLAGTVVFGAAHVPTVFTLPADQRFGYLVLSLPYITLVGGWLGALYRASGYRLGPPIAVHFWYDVTLGALAFALDPENHPFSAQIRFRF